MFYFKTSKLHMLGSITVTGPVCSILADDRGKVWIGSETEIHVISAMVHFCTVFLNFFIFYFCFLFYFCLLLDCKTQKIITKR
jgi:hypothetical protein